MNDIRSWFERIERYWGERNPLTSINRRATPSAEEFHRDIGWTGEPQIFFEPSSQPLLREDALEALKRAVGETLVHIRVGSYASPETYVPERRVYEAMRWSDYIASLSREDLNGITYAGNQPLPDQFLDLISIKLPDFYVSSDFVHPSLWLGSASCVTPLHRDSADNFAIHIYGKKRWTLFAPSDAKYLSMEVHTAGRGAFATSRIDLRKVDHVVFPEFQKARPLIVEVNAGETLYLPMGWGHFVETIDECLMVNTWLDPAKRKPAVLEPRTTKD